jgi:hypothetical protein
MDKVYELLDATYAHDIPAVCKILDTFSKDEIAKLCLNLDMLYSTAKYHIQINEES